MGRQWYKGIRGKIFGHNRQTKWEFFAVQYYILLLSGEIFLTQRWHLQEFVHVQPAGTAVGAEIVGRSCTWTYLPPIFCPQMCPWGNSESSMHWKIPVHWIKVRKGWFSHQIVPTCTERHQYSVWADNRFKRCSIISAARRQHRHIIFCVLL